ncbi:MAG: hypothetical protein IIA89_13420 [Chloroflexi bacterium]|nr:hypothetical protein [Chloroflexota bacterium]
MNEVRDAELDAVERFKNLFPQYKGSGIGIDSRGHKDRHGNIVVLCHAFHSGTDKAIGGHVTVTLYDPADPPESLYATSHPDIEEGGDTSE